MILKIENEAIDEAHHVLAVSAVTKKHLVDNCGAPPDKVSVAYNCYTLDQSRLMRKGSFAAGNVVFVGRMGWQKGPDVFVELAKRVHGKRPTTKFKMYGDGPRVRKSVWRSRWRSFTQSCKSRHGSRKVRM